MTKLNKISVYVTLMLATLSVSVANAKSIPGAPVPNPNCLRSIPGAPVPNPNCLRSIPGAPVPNPNC